MLVHQAAVAFELWTGRPAPIDAMLQAVVSATRAALDSQNVLYLSRPAADGGESRSFSEVTVALQGTLETFALPDVLRLLASTNKTGRLRLTGAAGHGFAVAGRRGHRGQRGQPGPAGPQPVRRALRAAAVQGGRLRLRRRRGPGGRRRPGRRRRRARLGREHARGVEVDRGRRAVARRLGLARRRAARRRGRPSTATRWQQVVAVAGGATVAQLGEILGLAELPRVRAP